MKYGKYVINVFPRSSEIAFFTGNDRKELMKEIVKKYPTSKFIYEEIKVEKISIKVDKPSK